MRLNWTMLRLNWTMPDGRALKTIFWLCLVIGGYLYIQSFDSQQDSNSIEIVELEDVEFENDFEILDVHLINKCLQLSENHISNHVLHSFVEENKRIQSQSIATLSLNLRYHSLRLNC